MLCDALDSTGCAGQAEEFFPERFPDGSTHIIDAAAIAEPSRWVQDWKGRPFEECLANVLEFGTTPNGVFAAKLKWRNMPYFQEVLAQIPGNEHLSLGEQMARTFPNPRYIWVTRRDKVRQAISIVRARQSGRWYAPKGMTSQQLAPHFNFQLIDAAVHGITREEAKWEGYFAAAGIVPFTVIYEDLVRDFEPTVRRLLDYLAVELPPDFSFPPPRLQKQADALSEEWVERYYAAYRTRHLQRTLLNLPVIAANRVLRETYLRPRLEGYLQAVPSPLRRLIDLTTAAVNPDSGME